MTSAIDVPITASGSEGIDRIVSSIDRLYDGLGKLGGRSSDLQKLTSGMKEMSSNMSTGLAGIKDQIVLMQQVMGTGLKELAAIAKGGATTAAKATTDAILAEGDKSVAAIKLNNQRIKDAMTLGQIQKGGSGNVSKAFNELAQNVPVEMVARRWGELAARAASSMDGQIDKLRQFQANSKSLWETHYRGLAGATEAELAKAHSMNVQWDAKKLAEKAAAYEKELALQAVFNQTQSKMDATRLAQAEAAQARLSASAAAAAERQRSLNTNFQTSSPLQQIATARKAQTYAGMGGDAAAKFGTGAAGADIRALEQAHARLAQVIPGTVRATHDHNQAMRDAHGLARGLAGSLGGLWLTYGSVAPLLAGAAIASSLKGIVEQGREVEHQLNFVFALSGKAREGVNLSQFLTITDSSLRSVSESANAMRSLAQNGLSASQSLQVLPAILDLATVGEMSVAQAAIAATGATSAFGLSFAEAGRVANIFAQTAATSNTSVIAITESMKQASTVASLFKVTIEETAGVLGVLAKINITGGAAGTAMTNMLTGFYEPTEKGKKALKELGVETMLATGALKPFSQMMEEVKSKLAGMNDSAKVDILGSIVTVRGLKAVQQIQENIGEYTKKVKEASTVTSFMRDVVTTLENDTTGAFTRLGVVVSNTFVRSFKDAQPFVQELAFTLTSMFTDKSTEAGISNFATNIARLTGALAENLGTVSLGVAGFMAYRAASAALTPVISAAVAATAASTTASAAAAAASIAHTTALAGGASTVALMTAATQAQTVATTAATAASAAWGAVLLPVLGTIAVAVAAGAALWLLFRDNTDEADRANTRISNSLHVVSEQLDKEIERLEKSNALWDARHSRFRSEAEMTPELLAQSKSQVAIIEDRIRKSGGDPDKVRNAMPTIDPNTGVLMQSRDWHTLGDALIRADEAAKKFQERNDLSENRQKPMAAAERLQQATAQQKKEMETFAKNGTEKDSAGKFFDPDAKRRAKYLEANKLIAEMEDPAEKLDSRVRLTAGERLADIEAENERVQRLATSLKVLRGEINTMQSGRAAKPDTKGANAAARLERQEGNSTVEKLKGDLERARAQSQYDIADKQRANRRGELGDLQMINFETAEKVKLEELALDIAQKQAAVKTLTPVQKAKADNDAKMAGLKVTATKGEGADKITSRLAAMAEEERAYAADTMREKGQYVDAFLSDWDSKNLVTLNKLKSDALNLADETNRGLAEKNATMLEKARDAGANSALFDQIGHQFDLVLDQLGEKLDALGSKGGPGTGLAEMFTNALAAEQAYEAALPALADLQRSLDLTAQNGNPQEQKAALDQLAKMKQQASAMRGIWIGVADTIGDALTRAFGRAGTAVGGLLKTTAVYGAKRKQIDEDYAKADKGSGAKKAVADAQAYNATTGAQIKMYGDLSGAAQGFFTEGSKGYIMLGAAEKAFRVIELGMAIQNAVTKSGLISMITGLFVTGETVKAGAAATGAAAIAGANTVIGTSAAAAGVATQAVGEPYTAWARMAAMAAVMATLGFVVSGGFGSKPGKSAADVQKEGSGTVFGDAGTRNADGTRTFKDKSDSIRRSLELVASHSGDLIPINTGMLDALRAIQNSMSGLVNMIVRVPGLTEGENMGIQEGTIKSTAGNKLLGVGLNAATGAAIGLAMAGPVGAVVMAVVSAIGAKIAQAWGKTTQKITDSGLQFGGSVRDLQGGKGFDQYASVDTTKSSWFGMKKSTSNAMQVEGLDPKISQQFGLVFTNLEIALGQAAVSLGGSAADVTKALDTLELKGSASLKGLTGDALSTAISNMMSAAMDQMAGAALPGLDESLLRTGEGYAETIIRLANNYKVLDRALTSIGGTFGAVGMSSLVARERLISMTGGIDKFEEQTKGFAENFLTKAERLAPVQKHVTEELGRLGYAGLKTRDEFKAAVMGLVNGGALATEAGAKTFTGMMRLQAAFAETTPEIKDLTKTISEVASEAKDLQDELDGLTMTRIQLIAKERAQLDPSNRAMFDQIQAMKKVAEAKDNLNDAYEKERTAIEETIDRIGGLAKSWKKFRDGLLLGDKSPLTPEGKYQEARRQYDVTLAAAKGGDKDAQDRYEEVANNFLEASRVSNSSSDLYTADFNDVMKATAEAITWAEQQVDVAKESLKALERQVGALIEIKAAVMSVVDAIRALDLAQASTPQSRVTEMYRSVLKRAPDEAGLKFFQDAMAKGSTAEDVAAAMRRSAEYTKQAAQPQPTNQATQEAQQAAAPAGPTAEQMAALLAEMAAMRAEAQRNTGAGIDAAFASTASAAATTQEAVAEAIRESKWDRQNKVNIE